MPVAVRRAFLFVPTSGDAVVDCIRLFPRGLFAASIDGPGKIASEI